jgi:hypothetical protein
VRVRPGETHKMQVVLLDPAPELLGLPCLFLRAQAVPFDESRWLAQLMFRA